MQSSSSLFILSLALFGCLATAEPPRGGFRGFRGFPQRQVAAPQPDEAPYPPSGWKPDKPFYLPGEEVTTEKDAEEVTTEGTVESTTEPEAEEVEPEAEEVEPEAEPSIPADATNKLTAQVETAPGYYYVLVPQQEQPRRASYQVLIPGPQSSSYILRDVEAFGAPLYYLGDQGYVQIVNRR